MSFRLNPRNLCMADAMPFQQHHEARVFGRNLEDILTHELLLDVRSNLQVGDEIVICGYADHTASRLTQVIRVRVFAISKDQVKLVRDGKTLNVPLEEGESRPAPEALKMEVVRGFNCFNVIAKDTGAVLESFKTKGEAEEWMAAHQKE